jgi:hypothetical protein
MGSRCLGWLAAAALAGACAGWADEPVAKPVTITLKDGGTLVGTIVAEDDAVVTLRTASGTELKLPREAIASRGEVVPEASGAPDLPVRTPLTDPNESRLMFAPTGRPLGKGNGYFSDHYVIFPGFAVGLTNHVALAGGISTIPAVGLHEQIYYLSMSSGWKLGKNGAIALGGLITGNPSSEADLSAASALFGVATVGHSDRSLSVGLAAIAVREEVYDFDARGDYAGSHGEWRFRDGPVVMLGGSLRVARNLSLISESWLFLGKDFDLSTQPFGVALRFFNGRISADVGMVLVGEIIEEGFPVPWLSFSYHFGPSRSKAAARKPSPAMPAWARAGRGGR